MRSQNTHRRDQIRRMLESGKSQTAIAAELGIHQTTVCYYAKRIDAKPGWKTRTERTTDSLAQEIQAMARRFVARELAQ